MMERRLHHSLYELLQQDRYTAEELAEVLWPEEAAELLGIGLDVVRHAAFAGELRAEIADHHIVGIRRDDLLAWLTAREGESRADTGA